MTRWRASFHSRWVSLLPVYPGGRVRSVVRTRLGTPPADPTPQGALLVLPRGQLVLQLRQRDRPAGTEIPLPLLPVAGGLCHLDTAGGGR